MISVKKAVLAAVTLLFIGALGHLGLLDGPLFVAAGRRLAEFAKDLFPPDAEALPTLFFAMLETIEIAFVGTLIGFFLALVLAFFASREFFGSFVSGLSRAVIAAVRAIPSILFGVLFVVAFGLGPSAGVMGVALYSVGYMGKLFYEAFESVDAETLDAVRAAGAGKLQLFRFVILPESANAVWSQVLFMFEYNIRASSIMGFVGAGGIGYYMLGYVQMLQYRSLMTAILLTFAVVLIVDFLSLRLRLALAHIQK